MRKPEPVRLFNPLWKSAIALGCLLSLSNAVRASERPWDPLDSMQVRYISLNPASSPATSGVEEPQIVTAAPDGQHFFYLAYYGDVESDAKVLELHVHETRTVRTWLSQQPGKLATPPRPYRKFEFRSFSSDSNEIGILNPQWEADSEGIIFLGTVGAGPMQVQRLNIHSGKIEQITRHADGVTAFLKRGRGVILDTRGDQQAPITYPATIFKRNERLSISSDWTLKSAIPLAAFDGAAARELAGGYEGALYTNERMSPDGRYAIGLYEKPAARTLRSKKPPEDSPPWQFVLASIELGSVTRILGAVRLLIEGQNFQRLPPAFWSADSTRVILISTVVPGDADVGKGRTRTYIVEYEIASGKWKILEPMLDASRKEVSDFGWLREGEELLVTHRVDGKSVEGTVYSFTNSGIVSRAVNPSATVPHVSENSAMEGLSFRLRKSANVPHQLVVSNGTREASLTETDPTLKAVWLAEQEPFQWQEGSATVTGGLSLPRGSAKARPVPLVIQVSHYLPEWFVPDGETGSYATQALAARGFAVLTIDFSSRARGILAPERFVERIDAAVDALVASGIADPDHIGMVGFSRGGQMTYFTITHPSRTRVAAAVCADSWRGDYNDYLFNGALRGNVRESEEVNGHGKSFWDDKQGWLEREASFNVDRATAATLFTLHARNTISHEHDIETIGAFVLNKKPVEYLYFPAGTHPLQRPRERLALMESIVDWMAFWLQGYEDPSPQKAARNAVWRAMRDRTTSVTDSRRP